MAFKLANRLRSGRRRFERRGDSDDPSDRPLRIGYVVHTFDVGGLERCVARLANHLDRRKFEPLVICLNRTGSAEGWLERATPIFELHKRTGQDWGVVRRLAEVLREQQIDIAHSHNWGTLLETVLACRGAPRVKHLHAEHGTLLSGAAGGRARQWVRRCALRWALNQAGAVVAVARSVQRRVSEGGGIPPERIEVIPNGVDVPQVEHPAQQRRELRRRLGIRDDAVVIGSVGRLAAVKRFSLAVEACTWLIREGLDVHLILIGDGPEADSLRRLAQQWQVTERVHLVGQQADVGAWLVSCDVYVNSSCSEGMNLAILEAMGLGLPCVVTDVGDNATLVRAFGECGRVVAPESPSCLSAALKLLVEQPELRTQMSGRGIAVCRKQFAMQTMTARYEEAYRRLAAGRERACRDEEMRVGAIQ